MSWPRHQIASPTAAYVVCTDSEPAVQGVNLRRSMPAAPSTPMPSNIRLPGSGTVVYCCINSANARSVGFDDRVTKFVYEIPSPVDELVPRHCGGNARWGTTDNQ